MKRFATRSCAKISRFFWSRGFLKFILWTITLIILFYVEEDWRGARAWAATKSEWEAKGESLDYYGKFIPPPIPDSENLAAIPLFKIEPDPKSRNDPHLLALERAMRIGPADFPNPPVLAHWQLGEVNDLEKLQHGVAAEYTSGFKGANPAQGALDQYEDLFSFLPDLRMAAATHSEFQLVLDYSVMPPDSRALGPLTRTIRLSQILALDAILALNEHQSDVAVEDVKVNLQIAAGLKHDPTLVAGLVSIGMTVIGNGAIFDGLARHQWSDANLVELDHALSSINFLSEGQFALRGEAAGAAADIEYYKHSRVNPYGLIMGEYYNGNSIRAQGSWMVRFSPPWASGWWDQSKCQMADSILPAIAALDPQKHRAYPEISRELQQQIDQAKLKPLAYAPWNAWATVAVGPIEGSTRQFPAAQVWIDEARIACALERYRLAHGVYPNSLDALAPTYIGELPRDVINGEPYHYQLRADGTFLLYSVGWNQTDDGGKAFYEDHNDAHQKVVDYSRGDWVWPTPKPSSIP